MNPFLEVKAGKYVGYGLGLPLAMKSFMHEGELQVQSEENKGTIVTIVFKKPTLILMFNLRKF
jgi:signal transduction histidine kinase